LDSKGLWAPGRAWLQNTCRSTLAERSEQRRRETCAPELFGRLGPEKPFVPFCTNEGSRLGRSVTDITKLCPQSTILDGLAVRGGDVKNAQNEVHVWLRELEMI